MDRETLDGIILFLAQEDESLAECFEKIFGAEILNTSRGKEGGDLESALELFKAKGLDQRENIYFFFSIIYSTKFYC